MAVTIGDAKPGDGLRVLGPLGYGRAMVAAGLLLKDTTYQGYSSVDAERFGGNRWRDE